MAWFSDPIWLLLLPPGWYLLWRIQKVSYADAGRVLRALWLAVRVLVFTTIVLTLAGLKLRAFADQKQVVFLVDVSASVSPERRDEALRWVNAVMSRLHDPNQAGVVVFGADAAVERFPSSPRPLQKIESRIDVSATNIENGARLAAALFASDYQKHLVLITDGMENAGNAREYLGKLIGQGISVQELRIPVTDRAEATIESVRVPDTLTLKENFNLEVVASSNRENNALLQVYRNGDLLQEASVTLRPGAKTMLRLPEVLESPGVYRYQVKLQPANDTSPENNTGDAWVTVAGPPAILLVDEEPRQLSALAEALQQRGFSVSVKSPALFPFGLGDMLLYRAILVRNVPASSIQQQMPLLKQYVHDFGGGFAMIGGIHSFGPGGYFKTPVEELLPVNMTLVSEKFLPEIAMVLVIDKSGSMSFADRGRQKIDLADEGASRVASLLRRKDQLGVLAVDSVPKWVQPLATLRDPQSAIDSIVSIRAGGGGIYVFSGLRDAYAALASVKASVKHVILFADTADCEEKEGPGGSSSLALAQRAARDLKITTTAIGIGQKGDVDLDFLKSLTVAGQGRFYFTSDMYTLPEIFTQESAVVQRNYVYDKRFTPAFSADNNANPGAILQGIPAVPDLAGYVGTSLKSRARAALTCPARQEPVLAFWRYGLGFSAAFTSSPTPDWGAYWLQWREFDRFWAQFGRYLAGNPAPPSFRVSRALSGPDSTKIVIDALDAEGNYVNDADFAAALAGASGARFQLSFVQTAPGRYEAAMPSSDSLFGKIFRLDGRGGDGGGSVAEEAFVNFPARANPEAVQPSSEETARREAIAGKLRESPAQLVFPAGRSERNRPVHRQLILLAALLFLLDVALRKLDFRRLPAAAPPMPATQPVVRQPVDGTMSALKGRKQSVREQLPQPVIIPDLEPKPGPSEDHDGQPATTGESIDRLKEAKRRRRKS